MSKQDQILRLNFGLTANFLKKNPVIVNVVGNIRDVATLSLGSTVTSQIPSENPPTILDQRFGKVVIAFAVFRESMSDNDRGPRLFRFPGLKEKLESIKSLKMSFVASHEAIFSSF